jgi:hypothetical protein
LEINTILLRTTYIICKRTIYLHLRSHLFGRLSVMSSNNSHNVNHRSQQLNELIQKDPTPPVQSVEHAIVDLMQTGHASTLSSEITRNSGGMQHS